MAVVDFDNAKLEPLRVNWDYSFLNLRAVVFYQANQYATPVSNPTVATIQNTPDIVSFMFAGTFNVDGTEIYLYLNNTKAWKIYDVEFRQGDTYSFVIDIEVSGNT